MNDSNEDTIDAKTKKSIAKKRKLCENNHINDNVRSNRKICDREYCKGELRMIDVSAITVEKYVTKDIIDKVRMKSKTYLNIPNILIDDCSES